MPRHVGTGREENEEKLKWTPAGPQRRYSGATERRNRRSSRKDTDPEHPFTPEATHDTSRTRRTRNTEHDFPLFSMTLSQLPTKGSTRTVARHRTRCGERFRCASKASINRPELRAVMRERKVQIMRGAHSVHTTRRSLARHVNSPHQADYHRLKRLARFLIISYVPANPCPNPSKCTRTQTTRLCMGEERKHRIWPSHMQSIVSLSSGWSERSGPVEGTALGPSLPELRMQVSLKVLSDSSAAPGFSVRPGWERMRHFYSRNLLSQERVNEGHAEPSKYVARTFPQTLSPSRSMVNSHSSSYGSGDVLRRRFSASEATQFSRAGGSLCRAVSSVETRCVVTRIGYCWTSAELAKVSIRDEIKAAKAIFTVSIPLSRDGILRNSDHFGC